MLMSKKIYIIICLSLFLLFGNWGFLIHRTLHQVAIYALPEPLRNFYYAHAQELVAKAVDPDLRRKTDSTEESKHFIDLDAPLYKSKEIPNSWAGVVKKYGEKRVRKQGTLPWEIMRTYKLLVQAMKDRNKSAIILHSADLGHYLADATVPLHTTDNFDGQKTNQKGMHDLWETLCPQLYLEQYPLNNYKKAKKIANLDAEVWKCIRESAKLLKNTFESEKKAALLVPADKRVVITSRLNGTTDVKYTQIFAEQYHPLVKANLQARITRAVQLISDFWYTAWLEAGQPDLEAIYTINDSQKKKLALELDAWHSNDLFLKKMLRAKNGNK
jgi:hypothetical protein